ncbi:MAG: DNA-directed RNA polymerase subunit D [archaeon]|nr:MAG: DNA-directed RNA polymerase subunit D [archaeon]
MKIEKIKSTSGKATFIVRGIDFSFANALRRSVSEIPVLAVDTVEFYKNDSALYDEFLAHRLGLVPLKAPKTFTLRSKCTCKGKGCLKCTASFKLKAKGSKTVYTSELKGRGAEIALKEIPIVLLEKDQELELSAEAILETAKEHAKFSTGLTWFNALPEITIKGCDACGKCIEICPKGVIKLKDKGITINSLNCDMCEACVDLCKDLKDAISMKPSETDFLFNIESFGQLEPKKIFSESVKALDANLKTLTKAVK